MTRSLSPPTQTDVAKAAGVSRSTVSRALVNHASIPPETRERIRKIADGLGYKPDPLIAVNMLRVSSSGKRRTKAMIAYLTPKPLDQFKDNLSYHLYFESAQREAARFGFGIDPIALNDSRFSQKRLTDILIARGIVGVLVAPFENPYIRLKLAWEKFAAASIGFSLVNPRLSFASNNHYYTMALALRNLHRLGYRRIGLAIPPNADRYAGGSFSAAYCLYADIHMRKARIPRLVPSTGKWTAPAFAAWFHRHRPDAVVCITDEVRDWLAEMRVDVPGEVGLAHLSWNRSKADWAGIDEHNELAGAAAMQLVFQQLLLNERGAPHFPKSVLIDGEWAEGKTLRGIWRKSDREP